MTTFYWNKRSNRLYSWKASKYCVLVNDMNEADRKQLIEAGVLKPATSPSNCSHCNKPLNPKGGLGCFACEEKGNEIHTHSVWCRCSEHCEAKEMTA